MVACKLGVHGGELARQLPPPPVKDLATIVRMRRVGAGGGPRGTVSLLRCGGAERPGAAESREVLTRLRALPGNPFAALSDDDSASGGSSGDESVT